MTDVRQGLTHGEVVLALSGSDPVGIDAPFGWPAAFARALDAWGTTGVWPVDAWSGEAPDASVARVARDRRARTTALRLRATDRIVHHVTGGPPPLSVSTDRIAVVAMRCAALLTAAPARRSAGAGVDRLGGDALFEVYPAATLRQWRLHPPRDGPRPPAYKGPGATAVRDRLLERVVAATGLRASAAHRERLVRSDHALDALLCALTVRAAAHGGDDAVLAPPPVEARRLTRDGGPDVTGPVPAAELDAATLAAEGWIWVPQPVGGPRWTWT